MENVILHSTPLKDFQVIIGNIVEEKLREFKPVPPQRPESEYLTRREVCDLLKISLATLHYYTRDGILKSYRLRGKVLYKTVEVQEAVQAIRDQRYKRRA
jgi:excisionase family DNA binding protein